MSCPDCKKGTILTGEPTGISISSVHGAYLAAASEPTTKRALLLLTDAFGLPLVNCKIIADNTAKRLGCDVWIPDLFAGKPILGVDQIEIQTRPGERGSFLSRIRFYLSMVSIIPAFIRNRPSVVDKRLIAFIEQIQAERQYEKIGAFGFCFGGSTACRLAGTEYLASAVICHPGPVSEATLKAIKIPVSWVCAEEDDFFPTAKRNQFEALLAARKGQDNLVDFEFQDYKGTVHGFASRPDMSVPELKQAFEKAHDQIANWFDKTLPI